MTTKEMVAAPKFGRAAEVRAASFEEADNSVEVIWTTGASVRRRDWRSGTFYNEILEVTPKAVRLDRLNAGAPLLDTHDDWSLRSVIGSVVLGSARLAGGKGYARVRLSAAPEDAGTVGKIKDGIIRNISVGYVIHQVEKTVKDDGSDEDWRVVDWEPMEISAVPIPADAGSQRPFISVYTDDGKAQSIAGRSLVENGIVTLVIEVGVSMAMTETDPETGASKLIGVNIPASDRAFEFYLDVVQRQIADALTDPDNPWAEIYRGLHSQVTQIENGSRRNADDGQRLAGHQTRISVMLIDDPLKGEALDEGTPFAAFLAAMEASSDTIYQTQAETIRGLLTGTNEDWQTLQRVHGMTASQLLALGRGPIAQDADRATPPMDSTVVDVDGTVVEVVV